MSTIKKPPFRTNLNGGFVFTYLLIYIQPVLNMEKKRVGRVFATTRLYIGMRVGAKARGWSVTMSPARPGDPDTTLIFHILAYTLLHHCRSDLQEAGNVCACNEVELAALCEVVFLGSRCSGIIDGYHDTVQF